MFQEKKYKNLIEVLGGKEFFENVLQNVEGGAHMSDDESIDSSDSIESNYEDSISDSLFNNDILNDDILNDDSTLGGSYIEQLENLTLDDSPYLDIDIEKQGGEYFNSPFIDMNMDDMNMDDMNMDDMNMNMDNENYLELTTSDYFEDPSILNDLNDDAGEDINNTIENGNISIDMNDLDTDIISDYITTDNKELTDAILKSVGGVKVENLEENPIENNFRENNLEENPIENNLEENNISDISRNDLSSLDEEVDFDGIKKIRTDLNDILTSI